MCPSDVGQGGCGPSDVGQGGIGGWSTAEVDDSSAYSKGLRDQLSDWVLVS